MLDVSRCDRLIVFGGSFDPPHRGHTELPFHVADAIGADGVLYVPAGQPPHKPDRTLVGASDRVAMLRLALSGNDRAAIDTIEIDRDGPSFTVDTLESLRERLGDRIELRLLMGADMLVTFDSWKDPDRIVALAEPVVMAREPLDREAMLDRLPATLAGSGRAAWSDRIVPTPAIDVSSTGLRRRLTAGDYDSPVVTEALDPSVLDYIRQRGLYRAD